MASEQDAPPPIAERERLAALGEPDFRWFLASRFCSATAMTGLRAAIAWHVFALTGSPFQLGLLGAVQFVPALGLSLVGGAFADAHDRRRIAQVAQLRRGRGRSAARRRLGPGRGERVAALRGGLRRRARRRLREPRARGAAPAGGLPRPLRGRRADPLDRAGVRLHDGARARRCRDRSGRRGGRLCRGRCALAGGDRRPRPDPAPGAGRRAAPGEPARDPRRGRLRPQPAGAARLHDARHVRRHLRGRFGPAPGLCAGDPARRAAGLRRALRLAGGGRARDVGPVDAAPPDSLAGPGAAGRGRGLRARHHRFRSLALVLALGRDLRAGRDGGPGERGDAQHDRPAHHPRRAARPRQLDQHDLHRRLEPARRDGVGLRRGAHQRHLRRRLRRRRLPRRRRPWWRPACRRCAATG